MNNPRVDSVIIAMREMDANGCVSGDSGDKIGNVIES